jgi:hypothetical protein
MKESQRIPWHKLLGSALADALIGLPYSVSTEEELALRSQRLDVLIIEQAGAPATPTQLPTERPDGLEDLVKHNLLSFKAADEPFNAFAAEELLSHAVTYRKVASLRELRVPAPDEEPTLVEPPERYRLLPVEDFRCFAVTTRFPRQLVKQLLRESCQKTEKPGIYRLRFGTQTFRLVVINQLDPHPRNAPWGLFATEETRWRAAFAAYHAHTDIGLHLRNLIAHFRLGDGHMAYTQDDMHREAREWLKGLLPELLPELDPEERLKGLTPEQRLKGLDPEERLKGLDPEFIEAWLAKWSTRH